MAATKSFTAKLTKLTKYRKNIANTWRERNNTLLSSWSNRLKALKENPQYGTQNYAPTKKKQWEWPDDPADYAAFKRVGKEERKHPTHQQPKCNDNE